MTCADCNGSGWVGSASGSGSVPCPECDPVMGRAAVDRHPLHVAERLSTGKVVHVGLHSWGQPDEQHARLGRLTRAEQDEAWQMVDARARAHGFASGARR